MNIMINIRHCREWMPSPSRSGSPSSRGGFGPWTPGRISFPWGMYLIIASFAIATLFVNNAVASTTGPIAVLNFVSGSKLDGDLALAATDAVRRKIAAAGEYAVMDQRKMENLLQERSGAPTGCAEKRCASEAGRILNVKTVILGSLNKVGNTYYLTLSRFNVHEQNIEYVVDDKSAGGREDLLRVASQMTDKLLGIGGHSPQRSSTLENKRFIYSKATVFDKEKGLMWLRNADSAEKTMTWDGANDYVRHLNKQQVAGFDDWRLPEKDELSGLVEFANNQGVKRNLNEYLGKMGFTNVRADFYWTASLSEEMGGLAWALDLYTGMLSTANMGNPGYVWPVRRSTTWYVE